jgi:hypothetical protein
MELPFAEIVECCRRVGPASMSAPPKPGAAALTKRAFVEALENAYNLNKKLADLRAQLRAARQSVSDLKESARAIVKGRDAN